MQQACRFSELVSLKPFGAFLNLVSPFSVSGRLGSSVSFVPIVYRHASDFTVRLSCPPLVDRIFRAS